MPIIKNHKITGTVNAALDYILKDKDAGAALPDVKNSISYAMRDKRGRVVYKTRKSCMNCNPSDPYKTFAEQIEKFGKDEVTNGNKRTKDGKPVLAWHYIQSFDSRIDPNTAHEIGRKFAEEMFPGFPVVIGTHTNTDHTHNHIIICAWDLDGKKWHQHNRVYQKAREVSDRISEEYGISTIENTRKQKLVQWHDKEGGLHYYEPTDRKNARLSQREKGELPPDDVGSYRNTQAYEKTVSKETSFRNRVRADIDTLLPHAESYDALVQMLRQVGYEVKDKKKNGDYLKYVSFKPPSAERGLRDSSLAADGYYLRENLERVIQEKERTRAENRAAEQTNCTNKEDAEEKKMQLHPQPVRVNEYTRENIDEVDEEYRLEKTEKGYRAIRRSPAEKSVIRDAKSRDREVRFREETGNKRKWKKKSNEELLREIQDDFRAVKVMEEKHLVSDTQIQSMFSVAEAEARSCEEGIRSLYATLETLSDLIPLAREAEEISAKIEKMTGDAEYSDIEREDDEERLKECRKTLRGHGVKDARAVIGIEKAVIKVRERTAVLEKNLSEQRGKIAELKVCCDALNRSFGRDDPSLRPMNGTLITGNKQKQTKGR